MRITSIRHIEGPNVYIYKPVLIALIELDDMTNRESYEVPGFIEALLEQFPGLREHHCAKGRPGGFVDRLYGGTYFGHIIEHVAIELASRLGLDVHYGKTLYAEAPGRYEIVMECQSFACQEYLLYQALDIVHSLIAGREVNAGRIFARAEEILAETELGPSTEAIVRAAKERDIPVRRLNQGSLIQLGYGVNRRLVQATITERTSAVSVDIASDKDMTKQLLRDAGVPVPHGGVAIKEDEAAALFREVGAPLVLKPDNGSQGRGVSLNLQSEAQVREAYRWAAKISPAVVVERYFDGKNIRLLAVNGKFIAASQRIPAHVVGDGQSTIEQLVARENENPLRGAHHELPLTRIRLDETAMKVLTQQGFKMNSVPAADEVVYLRDSANLSTGGEAVDITATVHERYKIIAERAARVMGLDICGVDMVVREIAEYDERCVVIEVNAAPGIRMHEHPSYGLSRDVGEAIVDALYPDGSNGRIPIVAVTGTNGKTTTTRLISHALNQVGYNVGMTTTSGVYIGSEKIVDGDTTGPQSARMVLGDPAVDAAVLETARGGIVRGGLAYEKANVAVLTNITLDHVGQDFVETLDDLVHIKSLVAECVSEDGVVVLNADDRNLVDLSRRLRSRIAFFSLDEQNPILQRHLAEGGVGYWVSRGWLMEGRGNLTWELAYIRDIPLTMDGTARFQVENCLAASAALRTLGVTRREIKSALTAFYPSANPGRCNIYRMPNGSHVVLDYGHNPAGYHRVGEWIRQAPHRRLFGVVGVPGDRVDSLVRESAREAAAIFDYLIVKEDQDKRGRREAEVAGIMSEEIKRVQPGKPCYSILEESEALGRAIEMMESNDITVVFYEALEPLVQLLKRLHAEPVNSLSRESSRQSSAVAMR